MFKKVLLLACINLYAPLNQTVAVENDKPLTIFAAASLTDVMQKLAENWATKTGQATPRLSFAASAIMARQIKAGAPADIFISANPDWVKYLVTANLTEGNTITVAENTLVFATPTGTLLKSSQPISGKDLPGLSSKQRIAIADPALAPAGVYAQKYLEQLGIWNNIYPKLAFGGNVRQTLLLIERGGLSGFVYASDAKHSNHVRIAFTVPKALSGAVLYQATKIKEAASISDDFIIYLISPDSRPFWQQAGFTASVPK